MRLYFSATTRRPAININRLNRLTFNIREIILPIAPHIDALVVLGDGSPEDEVVGILAHYHQDIDKIVDVIKPDRHGVDSFSTAKFYFEQFKAECLLFIIDQDEVALNELFHRIQRTIRQQGITVASPQTVEGIDKAQMFQCSLAGKEFRIIAAISGVTDFNVCKHEIEDHLLMLAGINAAQNSKEAWRQLPKDRQEEVLTLLKSRERAREAFPQHFAAFSQL